MVGVDGAARWVFKCLIVTQQGLAGVDVAAQEGVGGLDQQGTAKGRVALGAGGEGVGEGAGEGHSTYNHVLIA